MSCAIWLTTHLIRNSEIVIKPTVKMLRLKSLSGILSFSQAGQLVLMVIAFCLGTCMKASAPLPDCSIDNAPVQFFPHCIDWLEPRATHQRLQIGFDKPFLTTVMAIKSQKGSANYGPSCIGLVVAEVKIDYHSALLTHKMHHL